MQIEATQYFKQFFTFGSIILVGTGVVPTEWLRLRPKNESSGSATPNSVPLPYRRGYVRKYRIIL